MTDLIKTFRGIYLTKKDLSNPQGYFTKFKIEPSNKIYSVELIKNDATGDLITIIKDNENNMITFSNNQLYSYAPSKDLIDIIFNNEYSQILFESLFNKYAINPFNKEHGVIPLFTPLKLKQKLLVM